MGLGPQAAAPEATHLQHICTETCLRRSSCFCSSQGAGSAWLHLLPAAWIHPPRGEQKGGILGLSPSPGPCLLGAPRQPSPDLGVTPFPPIHPHPADGCASSCTGKSSHLRAQPPRRACLPPDLPLPLSRAFPCARGQPLGELCRAVSPLCHTGAVPHPRPPGAPGTLQARGWSKPQPTPPGHSPIPAPCCTSPCATSDKQPAPVQSPAWWFHLCSCTPSSPAPRQHRGRLPLPAGCPQGGKEGVSRCWQPPVPTLPAVAPIRIPLPFGSNVSVATTAVSGGAPLAANKAHPVLLDLWLHLLDPSKGSAKGSCAGCRLVL